MQIANTLKFSYCCKYSPIAVTDSPSQRRLSVTSGTISQPVKRAAAEVKRWCKLCL